MVPRKDSKESWLLNRTGALDHRHGDSASWRATIWTIFEFPHHRRGRGGGVPLLQNTRRLTEPGSRPL